MTLYNKMLETIVSLWGGGIGLAMIMQGILDVVSVVNYFFKG